MPPLFQHKMYYSGLVKKAIVLLFCAVLLFLFVAEQIITNAANNFYASTASGFETIQSRLDYAVERIEFFMNRVYTDEAVLTDFLRYFSHDAESYLSSRLDNLSYDEKEGYFLRECKNFVIESGYQISSIVFLSNEKTANLIHYSKNGNITFQFSVPERELFSLQYDTDGAYTYVKTLPYPNDVSHEMGKIFFIFNKEETLGRALSSFWGTTALETQYGTIMLTGSQEDYDPYATQILSTEAATGEFRSSLFSRTYYTRLTDKQYNIALISFVDASDVYEKQAALFFYTILMFISGYFLILFYFVHRSRHDTSFVSDIIASINAAKQGEFSRTILRKRNDEFGLIAAEVNDMSEKMNVYIKNEFILKLAHQKAEMTALQNQIDPHFLYNTLEIIRSRALLYGNTEVSDAISNLGSMYRHIVRAKSELPLSDEVTILNEYIRLMEFKYPDNFCCQIDIAEEMMSMMTVKLWMQPIAENFLKHGFRPENPYNLLMIVGERTENGYHILFSDNGTGMSEEAIAALSERLQDESLHTSSASIGLQNVYRRLRYFYNDQITIHIYNNKEAGMTVEFSFTDPLPFFEEDEHV